MRKRGEEGNVMANKIWQLRPVVEFIEIGEQSNEQVNSTRSVDRQTMMGQVK